MFLRSGLSAQEEVRGGFQMRWMDRWDQDSVLVNESA